jgi:hypothetical protein
VDETLDHISLHCGFAQGVWAGLVGRLGLPDIVPVGDDGINEWCIRATHRFPLADRKKANSLIMLTLRMLWLERNARVFDGNMSPLHATLGSIIEEWRVWCECRGRRIRDVH